MEINVRLYKEVDLPEMVRIWNEIIEAGIYFDYDEILTVTLSAPGLQSRLLPLWLKMKMATSTACTSFILMGAAAALTSPTQARKYFEIHNLWQAYHLKIFQK